MKKKNSYDEWWLRKDMENMGYIFEYCHKYCKKLFGIEIDRIKFINKFMISDCRYEMETGHPMLLSQSAIDTIEDFIEQELNNEYSAFTIDGSEQLLQDYTEGSNQLYWIGWIYAYIHFEKDMLSRDIIKKLPIENMLKYYNLGHEMDRAVLLEKLPL